METTNELVRDFINGYYRPVDQRLAAFRDAGETLKVPIILKETEAVLSMLLKFGKPTRILEIGTAIGYSAAYFAWSCPEAEIITVEKDEYAYKTACANIEMSGLSDRVTLLMGDGQEQIEKLKDDGAGRFDFVFIDAAKSHYRRFLESAITVCSPGAMIVSDNILMHGMTVTDECDPKNKHRSNIRKMREYVDFITVDKRLETTLMSTGDGLAVSVYKGNNE